MATFLLAAGAASALPLLALLLATLSAPHLRIWPTPGPLTWQSIAFWGLFRTLNVATLGLVTIDLVDAAREPWLGLPLPARVAGAAVAGVCGVLYLWSLYSLGRANTYCQTGGLVTHGLYRWTRNPQYATVIPAYAGLAIAADFGGRLRPLGGAHLRLRLDGPRRGAVARTQIRRRLQAVLRRRAPLLQRPARKGLRPLCPREASRRSRPGLRRIQATPVNDTGTTHQIPRVVTFLKPESPLKGGIARDPRRRRKWEARPHGDRTALSHAVHIRRPPGDARGPGGRCFSTSSRTTRPTPSISSATSSISGASAAARSGRSRTTTCCRSSCARCARARASSSSPAITTRACAIICGLHFGGIEIEHQTIHTTADGRRYLVIHGDEFDVVVRYAQLARLPRRPRL